MVIFICPHWVPRTFEHRCFEKPADASETTDVGCLTKQDHTCTPRVDGSTPWVSGKASPLQHFDCATSPRFPGKYEARYLIQSRSAVRWVQIQGSTHHRKHAPGGRNAVQFRQVEAQRRTHCCSSGCAKCFSCRLPVQACVEIVLCACSCNIGTKRQHYARGLRVPRCM